MSLIDTIVQGALLGGVYALFALGLSLIFGVMRLVNLAHGDLIVLSAFIVLALTTSLGLSLPVATAITIVAMFCIGFALQRLVFERVLGEDIMPPLLITFGLSIVVQNGLLLTFGADSRRLEAGAFETQSLQLMPGLTIGLAPLLALMVAVAVILLLQVVFYRTSLGRAFRATSDNAQIAQLMGIDHRNIHATAVGISLAVSVIAGGLGSLWGTLAGGMVLGIAQTVGARVDPEWQILAGHVAFLAVLFVRPHGLFPARRP